MICFSSSIGKDIGLELRIICNGPLPLPLPLLLPLLLPLPLPIHLPLPLTILIALAQPLPLSLPLSLPLPLNLFLPLLLPLPLSLPQHKKDESEWIAYFWHAIEFSDHAETIHVDTISCRKCNMQKKIMQIQNM
jgi:hypothetical protein